MFMIFFFCEHICSEYLHGNQLDLSVAATYKITTVYIQNSDAHTCVMMVLIVLIIPYFNLSKRVSCMLLHQLI